MNTMRENSVISHNDAWFKHIKKVSQSSENAQLPASVAPVNTRAERSSRQTKWGK